MIEFLEFIFTHWKKCLLIPGTLFFLMTMSSCYERINPGEVGVVVDMLGSKKGVEDKELMIGYHMILPWQSLYRFPTFEQNHEWSGDSAFVFQTSEGMSVHADIGITFNLVPNRIHELFCKYRRGMDEITDIFIRNNIRDAINRIASKMNIEELYGPKKEDFFAEVLEYVKDELDPLGFNLSRIYIIGKFQVPDNVLAALNKKIEATQLAQQRENELREAEAQAKKEIAKSEGEAKSRIIKANADAQSVLIDAQSQAKANEILSKSISGELLHFQSIEKWDGKLPNVMGSDKIPFILPIK